MCDNTVKLYSGDTELQTLHMTVAEDYKTTSINLI